MIRLQLAFSSVKHELSILLMKLKLTSSTNNSRHKRTHTRMHPPILKNFFPLFFHLFSFFSYSIHFYFFRIRFLYENPRKGTKIEREKKESLNCSPLETSHSGDSLVSSTLFVVCFIFLSLSLSLSLSSSRIMF